MQLKSDPSHCAIGPADRPAGKFFVCAIDDGPGDGRMDKDMIAATLRDAGFQIQSSARMGDGDGWRITLTNGAVVHCFDDGRCIVHGSGAARLRSLLRANRGGPRPANANSPRLVGASQRPSSAGAGTGGATSHQPGAETKRQTGGHDGEAHDRSRR